MYLSQCLSNYFELCNFDNFLHDKLILTRCTYTERVCHEENFLNLTLPRRRRHWNVFFFRINIYILISILVIKKHSSSAIHFRFFKTGCFIINNLFYHRSLNQYQRIDIFFLFCLFNSCYVCLHVYQSVFKVRKL